MQFSVSYIIPFSLLVVAVVVLAYVLRTALFLCSRMRKRGRKRKRKRMRMRMRMKTENWLHFDLGIMVDLVRKGVNFVCSYF